MKVKRRLWTWVFAVLAAFAVLVGSATPAFAAAGDVPEHGKYLKDNGDGTYTIALNVKGDAEKDPQKVNVIVVFDTSSSMNTDTGNTEVTYTATSSEGGWNYQNNLYGLIDGEYRQLTRTNTGSWNNPSYHFWYNGTEYTGQRYTRQQANQSRLQAAEAAVNELASALLAYNTQEGNDPDTVEMALVDFANTAEIAQAPTTSYSAFEAVVNSRNAGNNDRGTNWEAGLRTTLDVDFGDDDPTYVIFVSDGNPTFYMQDPGNTQRGGTGRESDDNIATSYNQAVPAAQAVVNAGNEFYTIGIYGNVSRMQSLTTAAGAPAANYYSAEDTAALQAALAEILAKIEMSGIGNVGINDGTTSNVGTSTEPIELLEVVPNFKYYRAGGDYSDLADYDPEHGEYGQEWTDAPAAQFTDPTVTWNIPDLLENDVVYTVTFDCYPSQTTLDTIADIKNDPTSYDSLPQAIKDYIDRDGNLATNTTATLSWTDTRTGENGSEEYTNPDPVETQTVEQMAVSKEWKNELEDEWDKPESITLDVTRDGDNHYSVTMSDENEWKDDVYVSIGLIKDGEALDGAHGHDFTFVEPAIESGYRWEIDVPVVHPMKIDGTVTMLILKGDAPYNNPDGTAEYTIDGKTYYVAGTGAASLTATNERRSSLNIVKAVTGVDVPQDATFPFTLNVKNALAPETAPADDPNHDSDYYVWISIWDKDQQAVTEGAVVSGATHSGGSWYYGVSGQDIVLNVKDGYSIRVNNVPVGTTYTITEGTLPTGFNFDGAAAAKTDGDDGGTTWAFTGGQTSTGSVDTTNAVYTVTYTNKYELIDINVDKVWADANDQDGMRPEELELTLNGLPAGTTAPTPEITKSEDGNTWTYTWKAVPRYDAQGNEITYTVTEDTVPDGYECTGSPANDGGTITNTHTPEVTDVTIVKEWDDSDDIGKIRPGTISAQLTADGVASGDPVELNASNQWTYTWSELPKYKDGVEIVYSADETEVPAGYDKTGPVETESDTGVTFTVTNTYNPTPVSVDPPVQKVIEGTEDLYNGGNFTFKIEAVTDGAPMPENTEITNSADYELANKPGFYEFGEIVFDMPGTYEYKVTEAGGAEGVTNDPAAEAGKTLTFTVTDDPENPGNLTVTPTTDDVQLSFTNVYSAEGEASIVVNKALAGAAWPEGKTLTFTIAGAEDAPMPEATTATLNAAGTVTFGPIAYELSDAGKTYTYTITEGSFGDGWTGTPTSITATVAVVDNGGGELGTTVTYSPEDATFTNTYKATGKATLEATKAIEGAAWPENGEITFTLAGQGGTLPETKTVTLTEPGKATFGDITYTEKDLAGSPYTYTISEDGFGDGWTGSGSVTATVTLTDNGDGTIGTKVTYSPEDATITNTYEAKGEAVLEVTKALVGAAWPEGKTLTLTLSGEGGTLPETKTVELTAEGKATFDAITYDESDAGKTYTYTISEDGFGTGWTGSGDVTATVVVTDNGDGTLKTEVSYSPEDATITNTYVAEGTAVLEVTKELAGANWPAGKTLTLTLSGVGGTLPETKTVELTAAGKATFGAITYDESDAGQTYTYTISEDGFGNGWTGTPTSITATVKVIDNGDGTLGTEVTYSPEDATITNTYKASGEATLEVTKAVTGAAWPAGKTLTLTLSGEGGTLPETKTATLSAIGKATFGPITYTEADAGQTYTYTISEDGFGTGWTGSGDVTATVKVTDKGDGTLGTEVTYSPEDATITNTYEASGSATLEATKELTGRDWQEGETFTFTLLDAKGNKLDEQAVSANGKVSFKTLNYSEADAGKTYEYTISETSELPANVEKSADIKATVEVTDNHDGTLGTKVTYSPENATITNTYTPTPVKATINVNKTIEGYVPGGDQTFTFTLTPGEGAPGEAQTKQIATENGTGKVSFEEIEYTKVGDYTYTVVETKGDAAGFTYDTTEYQVTVKVTDNPTEGKLEAKVVYAKEDIEAVDVINTFKEKAAEVTLTVKKVIEDQSGSDPTVDLDRTFTFVLTPAEGAPGEAQEKTITTTDLAGEVSFDKITFEKSGTYNYTIKETVEGETPDGWTYDTTEYPVVIKISDDFETAELQSETSIDGKAGTTELTITNVYKAEETESTIEVTKAIDDTSGSAPDDVTFTFTLAADGDAPMPENTTASVTGAGKASFDAITYTKVGDYQYTITETNDAGAGWTYDTATHHVTVSVSDEGGHLVPVVYYDQDESLTELTITNTYDPEDAKATLQARKVVDDQSDSAPAEDFQITLSGNGVNETKTTQGGYVYFSELTFDKVGKYEYTIQETAGSTPGFTYDTNAYKATVEVTDTGDGRLAAKVTYDGDEAVVTNVYKAEPTSVTLEVSKEITGLAGTEEAKTFTFALAGDAEGTATVTGAGTASFDEITYEKAGTYYYTVSEVDGGETGYTYDTSVYSVTVEVVDEGGKLVATPTITLDGEAAEAITFTNPYEPLPVLVPLKATKVLTGRTLKAGEFEFQLIDADGNVVKTVKNAADGTIDFGEIKFTEAGTYKFTAKEVKGSEANMTYDESEQVFEITITDADGQLAYEIADEGKQVFNNKYAEPPAKKRKKVLPQTSDPTNVLAIEALAAGGVAAVAAGMVIRRRKHEDDED